MMVCSIQCVYIYLIHRYNFGRIFSSSSLHCALRNCVACALFRVLVSLYNLGIGVSNFSVVSISARPRYTCSVARFYLVHISCSHERMSSLLHRAYMWGELAEREVFLRKATGWLWYLFVDKIVIECIELLGILQSLGSRSSQHSIFLSLRFRFFIFKLSSVFHTVWITMDVRW